MMVVGSAAADGWLVGDGMRLAWLYIDAIAGRYYRS